MDTFDHTQLTPPETLGDSPAQYTEPVFGETRPEPAPQPEIPVWSGAPEARIPEAPKPYFVPPPHAPAGGSCPAGNTGTAGICPSASPEAARVQTLSL